MGQNGETTGATNGTTNGATTTNGSNGTNKQPTHPDLLKVEYSEGFHTSRAVSLVDLPAEALFAPMGGYSSHERTWATVQTSANTDLSLDSDLVYCNHSCQPSLLFDTSRREIRVADRPLKKGDVLTFFYPSTEWDMSQAFDCSCGSPKGVCVGKVQGAKYMDPQVLKRYWLNRHIEEMVKEQARG